MDTSDKSHRLSFNAYEQLINSSRKSSPNNSFSRDLIGLDERDSESYQDNLLENQNAELNKKTSSSQSHLNFTKKLMQQRKLSSQAQISKAFNSIRDMNNKEQINQALLMITQVKDRVNLVEKLLDRREQIAKAKEMQAINNLAPLFNKIKAKFLSSLHKRKDQQPGSKKPQTQGTIIIPSQNDAGSNPQSLSYQDINSIQKTGNKGVIKSTNHPTLVSPTGKNTEVSKQEENNTIQQQNKNIMGAITIFATHDIKMDKEKEEVEKRQKQNKPLGYLQRDNILKGLGQEDRIKSPLKPNKAKLLQNMSTSSASGVGGTSNPITKKKNSNASNSQQFEGADINQKMQQLKKKMYSVGGGVGRRESPSSNSSHHFRIRSLNGSPTTSMKQNDMDQIKNDEPQKYFFKPQLTNFSTATHHLHNHTNSQSNISNTSFHQHQKNKNNTTATNKNDGILFDFILECEQKRLLSKSQLLNKDSIQLTSSQSQNNNFYHQRQSQKAFFVPSRKSEALSNPPYNGSILQQIFQVKRQLSTSHSKNSFLNTQQLNQNRFSKQRQPIDQRYYEQQQFVNS